MAKCFKNITADSQRAELSATANFKLNSNFSFVLGEDKGALIRGGITKRGKS